MMGIAQGIPTTYYYDASTTGDWVSWAIAVVDTPGPADVYSISYGNDEAFVPYSSAMAFDTEVIKLGTMGTTITVSSGDDGAMSSNARGAPQYCGYMPSYPASSPYVTAVGATRGPESNQEEISCIASATTGVLITSGGGFSGRYHRPDYQNSSVEAYWRLVRGTPLEPYIDNSAPTSFYGYSWDLGTYNSTGRGIPDVSLLGHSYITFAGGQTAFLDGTSASSPTFAAMVSLVNSQRAAAGKSKLGFLNPFLYSNHSQFLNDIVTGGKNNVTAQDNAGYPTYCSEGYFTTKGWDPVTGLGSVDFAKFLAAAMKLNGTAHYTYAPTATPTVAPTNAPSSSAPPTTSAAAYSSSPFVWWMILLVVSFMSMG